MAFKCNPAFNAFGYKFFDIIFHILEITVAAALCHCAQRTHAPVLFKSPAFINDCFARAFFRACKNISHHYATGAGSKGLYHIACIPDTAIADDAHIFIF